LADINTLCPNMEGYSTRNDLARTDGDCRSPAICQNQDHVQNEGGTGPTVFQPCVMGG
jgi:hypothetical protein